MKLRCQNCSLEIPADAINIDRMIAKCPTCSAVFSFEDQLGGAAQRPPRLDVPLPKGIVMEHQGYELEITRRWLSPKYFGMIFFCLFWDGFMCVWYSIALSQRVVPMALFGLLHLGVGVIMTYSTLAGFINRTRIRVSSQLLAVQHGPLPWWGNKQIDATGIAQIYCKERIARSRNGTSVTYDIHAATSAGNEEKLVTALDSSDQALYLEQEIERFLQIVDRPVAGELRK